MTTGTETLIVGGTWKTGRRVAERLAARGRPARIGSRTGTPPFDWDLTDGVFEVLGRAPRDFSDYARTTAASGIWEISK